MINNDDKILLALGGLAKQLGYEAELVQQSEDLGLSLLSIRLENDWKDIPQFLILSIFPMGEELDGSDFIQFYFQYPFEMDKSKKSQILLEQQTANQQLALGHFNLDADDQYVYFKYVYAAAKNTELTLALLCDVLDMCMFSQEHFLEKFEGFSV